MKNLSTVIISAIAVIVAFYLGHATQPPRFSGATLSEIPVADTTAEVSKADALTLKIYEDPKAARANLMLEFSDAGSKKVYENSMQDLDNRISNLDTDIILKQKEKAYYETLRNKAIQEMDTQGIMDYATSTP